MENWFLFDLYNELQKLILNISVAINNNFILIS